MNCNARASARQGASAAQQNRASRYQHDAEDNDAQRPPRAGRAGGKYDFAGGGMLSPHAAISPGKIRHYAKCRKCGIAIVDERRLAHGRSAQSAQPHYKHAFDRHVIIMLAMLRRCHDAASMRDCASASHTYLLSHE